MTDLEKIYLVEHYWELDRYISENIYELEHFDTDNYFTEDWLSTAGWILGGTAVAGALYMIVKFILSLLNKNNNSSENGGSSSAKTEEEKEVENIADTSKEEELEKEAKNLPINTEPITNNDELEKKNNELEKYIDLTTTTEFNTTDSKEMTRENISKIIDDININNSFLYNQLNTVTFLLLSCFDQNLNIVELQNDKNSLCYLVISAIKNIRNIIFYFSYKIIEKDKSIFQMLIDRKYITSKNQNTILDKFKSTNYFNASEDSVNLITLNDIGLNSVKVSEKYFLKLTNDDNINNMDIDKILLEIKNSNLEENIKNKYTEYFKMIAMELFLYNYIKDIKTFNFKYIKNITSRKNKSNKEDSIENIKEKENDLNKTK